MSKLSKYRPWLTLPEAARELSIEIGEHVTNVEIFRLALCGILTLSVNIVNFSSAQKCKIVAEFEAEAEDTYSYNLGNNNFLQVTKAHDCVIGVYDLPLIGGEVDIIENMLYAAIGGPFKSPIIPKSILVKSTDTDCNIYQLMGWVTVKRRHYLDGSQEGTFLRPLHTLPEDIMIVIRREALQEAVECLIGKSVDEFIRSARAGGMSLDDLMLKLKDEYKLSAFKIAEKLNISPDAPPKTRSNTVRQAISRVKKRGKEK